jgi:outer membrane protein assembly factor BamA
MRLGTRWTWARAAALALLATAHAAQVGAGDGFRVTGNRVLREGRVREILAAAGWKPGASAARLAALQEAYFREGHLAARIYAGPSPFDSATVVVEIEEGEPVRVGRARVSGARVYGVEAVAVSLGLEADATFRPREFDARVAELLRRYDVDGYPFAQVWIDSLGHEPDRNRVHVLVSVVEGTRRDVQAVRVEGLAKTRPDLAVRISGLRAGGAYSARTLDAAYVRLQSSRLFERVAYPTVRMSADGQGVDVILVVEEASRSNTFAAAVGYAAAEEERDRELSGLAHLRLENVGGTLKDFELLWNNDGKQRSETRLSYRDRFFLGRRLGVSARLEQIGQDTLYTWQSLGLGVERTLGRAGSGLVGVKLSAHGDRNVFGSGELARSWRGRGSLALSLLRGSRKRTGFAELVARATYARKTNYPREGGAAESVTQFIGEIEGEATASLAANLHLRFAPVFRTLESGEEAVPLSEQFYIGGARTLRGYRENQFHGRRVATLASELLIGPGRWENGYLFVDVGYVRQGDGEAGAPAGDLWRAGYGFGLRTGSAVGNIDLSFAVGEKPSLQQTKVHVLLEQRF